MSNGNTKNAENSENAGYRDRIEARVADLRATPGFTVRAFEIAPPLGRDGIEGVRAAVHGHLPEGLAEFHAELDGFLLDWEYTEPGASGPATDFGSLHFLPLAKVFADGLGDTWYDDFEGGDRFRAVKPFDVYAPEACAAFLQEPDSAPQDPVYFHYFGEALEPLDLTFPQYVEGALSACGYVNWRMALTPDDPGLPEARRTLERMREIVPGFRELP
ncbi:hypothetical protein [Streptomyces sp. NPDC050504]|uniref:hypothetical protein n=1 Tax=Streptomyces sp. NPDC050504 TaxID=3365618 RepID=UPI0037906BB9